MGEVRADCIGRRVLQSLLAVDFAGVDFSDDAVAVDDVDDVEGVEDDDDDVSLDVDAVDEDSDEVVELDDFDLPPRLSVL